MVRVTMPDGSETTRLDEDCVECPYPDRCDGNGCSEGSGGMGCAYCDNGANGTSQYYQSGADCKPCPDSQASNVIGVVIGIAVGVAFCVYIWKISTVAFQDGGQGADAAEEGTAGTAALDEIEGLKGDAETVAEIRTAVATMSSTAIVSGIALPSLFKISITFSLPFGTPKILSDIASWISQAVSIDMQFGNPECAMQTPDALTVFKMKFFLTHIGFIVFLIVLSLPAMRVKHRLHATNARIAAYTVAVGGLVKSCASSLACTEEVLGTYVNDGSARVVMMALPDEECWTSEHNTLAIFAALFLVVYVIVIPVLLFCKARSAAADGVWSNDELQQYGWLVLKYKESRWYFEFVILFDKIVFVAFAVFFAWERSAMVLIGFSIFATLVTLAFVAWDKPYRCDDAQPAGCLGGKEDKMMMLSLILQLVSFVLTLICYNDTIARRDYSPGPDEEPLEGLSPEVEFLAAAVGLIVVVVQIGMVWWACDAGPDDNEVTDLAESVEEAPESPAEAQFDGDESVGVAESVPQQQIATC